MASILFGACPYLRGQAERVALIPVPASGTTMETQATGRWPAKRLAEALARLGLGSPIPCVVHRVAKPPKHATGDKTPAEELRHNLVALQTVPSGYVPVYVDDVISWGNHVAAVDDALGAPEGARALVIAFADKHTVDAYEMRRRDVML